MDREQRIKEFHDFWFALIQKAFEKSPFDALCTLLRPRGMHDAGWDVLDESEATFEDFNWMLSKAESERGAACARRLGFVQILIPIFTRKDGVVPSGQNGVWVDVDRLELEV